MKRLKKYNIHLLISIVLLLGFGFVSILNYLTYSRIIKDDIENISKLSATNIYSEINNELTKPIFVSLTMANDSFLKEWLVNEENYLSDDEYLDDLKDYLVGIEVKYDYSSVFLVSEKTKNYYHYTGIQKVISEEDPHDQWYTKFKENGKSYELDVDTDEADNNVLTVFVNCRIENSKGELMVVAGVGLQMDQVQTIFSEFEDNYELETMLINREGLVQVHTDQQLIESFNVAEDDAIKSNLDEIIDNTTSFGTYRYINDGLDGYLITTYIDELDWYLVVKKDTSVLRQSFTIQLVEDLLFVMILVGAVLFLVNKLVQRYREQLTIIAKTDQLTGLLNRRGFDMLFNRELNKTSHDRTCVFILDIDNFKTVNDSRGHVFGDQVIKLIADIVKKSLGENAELARWGGDEFVGVIYSDLSGANKVLDQLIKDIRIDKNLKENDITVSIGAAMKEDLDTSETIISKADNSLYFCKENGKNQVKFN